MIPNATVWSAALTFLLVSLPIQHTNAQWSSNPSVNTPVSVTSNDQTNSEAVPDGAGGSFVVWEDFRNSYPFSDVYVQKIDAAGFPVWDANGIVLCNAPNNQLAPRIVSDGAGGSIITWNDYRNGDADVYAQRVNGAGVAQWGVNGVSVSGLAGNQWNPVLAEDGASGAIISWYEARGDTGTDIYAQRVNDQGMLLWQANGVKICGEERSQVAPVAVKDESGGCIITWIDFRNAVFQLFSQRVDQNGNSLWTQDGVPLCTSSDYQYSQDVLADANGGAIIVWHDFRDGLVADIYAQRVSALGIGQWPSAGLPVCLAADEQYNPVLATDNAFGVIIAWYDYRSASSFDVYSQRISAAGTLLWPANGVAVCTANNDQSAVTITSDLLDGVFIAWQDKRGGPNLDVYLQHASGTGDLGFPSNGIPVSVAVNDQQRPSVVPTGSGGAIVVWDDYRSGTGADIYASRIVQPNPNSAFGMWYGGTSVNAVALPGYAGFGSTSLDEVDPIDVPEAGSFSGQYLSLYSVLAPGTPTENFTQDIRTNASSIGFLARRWQFRARTNIVGALVSVSWTEDRMPAAFKPVLYELSTGSYRNLRENQVLTFTSPSTPGLPVQFSLLIGDSIPPSVSVLSPNGGDSLIAGVPTTVRWQASDTSGLLRHYIYFSLSDESPFTLIDSVNGSARAFLWTPSVASNRASIRIVSRDSVLNDQSDTSDTRFTIVPRDSIAYLARANWNLVSTPALQTDMRPSAVFGDDFGPSFFTVYQFNPGGGYSSPDTMWMGRGYWLFAAAPTVIDAIGSTQAQVTVSLGLSWNIIGNPFPVPYALTRLRVSNGIETKTLSDAASSGWILATLYGYNGSSYFPAGQSLAVWHGYWIFALVSNLTMVFDASQSLANHGRSPLHLIRN